SFDGVDDWVDCGNGASLNPANAMTLVAWYMPTVSWYGAGDDPIIDKPYTSLSGPTYQYHLGVCGDLYPVPNSLAVGFDISPGGVWTWTGSPPNTLAFNQWSFIVGTYDGSSMKLYVNGQLISSAFINGSLTDYGESLRFAKYYNAFEEAVYLPGAIDEIRIYNRALNQSDISYLFTSVGGGNQPPFAEAGGPYSGDAEGTITFDASGSYDPDGTITGYRWDWTNDGTWDTGWLNNATIPHFYSSLGTYTVNLEVRDDDGSTDSDLATVIITTGETILPFYDDFENIANGDYPSANGWQNMYSGANAFVSTDAAYSGAKSFCLQAYSDWARTDYVQINPPEKLSYECYIKVIDSSQGAAIGFSIDAGSYNPRFNCVRFVYDGNIYFTKDYFEGPNTFIQTYSANEWYKVKVDLEYSTNKATIFINDVQKATDVDIYPRSFTHYQWGSVTLDKFAFALDNFDGGDVSTVYFDDVRIEASGGNQRPIADFTWMPQDPNPNQTILFDASASSDADGYLTLYEWDWYNTGLFFEAHTTPTATFSWSQAGIYHVTLRITDNASATDSITKTVHVGNQPPNTPVTPFGPTLLTAGQFYTFTTGTTDPDGDQIQYLFDWDAAGSHDYNITPFVPSGELVSLSHGWNYGGIYFITVRALDTNEYYSEWSDSLMVIASGVNHPPNTPAAPTGSTSLITGETGTFSISATDPDDDNVFYKVNWGDGTETDWLGPYSSGSSLSISHSWVNTGVTPVNVKAKDLLGSESGWSAEHIVTIRPPNHKPNSLKNPYPTNEMMNVDINTDLQWTGGDQDSGDTVTYEIRLGTSIPPRKIAQIGPFPSTQGQLSYDPGTLIPNKKYYWKIVAYDNHEASTSSTLWEFTTGSAPNNPPSASIDYIYPNPVQIGLSVGFQGHGTDIDGTITEYSWRSSIDGYLGWNAFISTSLLSSGTHQIYFKVKDNNGAWSQEASKTLIVKTAGNKPPSTPSIPSGSSSGYTGVSYSFSTMATDPEGDYIYYYFDFNGDLLPDNSDSVSGSSGTTVSCSWKWDKPGTYDIRVYAKDSKGAQSYWSGVKQITIQTSMSLTITTDKSTYRLGDSIWITASVTSNNKPLGVLTAKNFAVTINGAPYYIQEFRTGTSQGIYQLRINSPSASGQHTITLKVTTSEGSISKEVGITLTEGSYKVLLILACPKDLWNEQNQRPIYNWYNGVRGSP
ncbi:MAG TPA: PKD domain-containing protein, partial [Candidatus Thermoplasmatota archaeon]|nr:PKD domain-containing protein [Candidatus Thermoplasmatota archaeon]